MKNIFPFTPKQQQTPAGRSPLCLTLLIALSLLLLLVACTSSPQADREATVAALGQAVVQTATAAADEDVSPQDLLATAEAAATQAVSTIAAFSTEVAAAAVTATALAAAAPPTAEPPPAGTPPSPQLVEISSEAVEAELALYGVDPAAGALVWFEPVALLQGPGLQQFQPDSPLTAVPLQDFVITANIIMGGQAAGCGFSLRADDLEQLSSQHLLIIGSSDPGPLLLQTWQDAALAPDPERGVAFASPFATDPNFSLEPGAANRLAVVAQGETFTVYSNGVLVAEFSPLVQLEAGLVALAGTGEAGCRFENIWLWAFAGEN
jgi:hypothetical protein